MSPTVQARAEQVPVTRVQDALTGLWERCRSAETPLTRALTMNLVAVTRAGTIDRLRADLRTVFDRHPCRAFVVVMDDRDAPTAEVGGESRTFGQGQEIVLEHIELRGSWQHIELLAAVIRPLLVNDIPNLLYWATDLPTDDASFVTLHQLVERAIVDSSLLRDPSADLPKLRSLAPGAVDLTWLRLSPWRRALAEAFEHVAWQEHVPTTVTLTHGPSPGARAASQLLADWLDQRLRATTEIVGDRQEQLELRHGHAHVLIKRLDDGRLRTEVSLADRCLLPFQVAAPRGTPGNLLSAAVDLAP